MLRVRMVEGMDCAWYRLVYMKWYQLGLWRFRGVGLVAALTLC